ncbi:putative transcriptional regulator of viral defense system [Arcanobacterium wilhelmae]|uniref:Transcriptional regulator of viral defense system n=1 Tax=Arcanobacterium wilhelmae TaxID=1803177 RepID=A0ABT9NAD3_9ACTO|nr:type IV toxin-antitoxin system AbiEi family antitoxin domain-containing protein [Arcanobacterium wilhelmae]MDP9800684.1 putative transcriptional regulator of viral defense system [Arcanobacterium wilhelmae]WFN90084.1 type IV toxin-antitoxin system AbiEi family antitoxin domain-containing protein [Arcanobacterium wilhelmae]
MGKIDELREIALDQHGYVATAQAHELGVTDADLSKMVARGRIERVERGVYLIPGTPEHEFGDYQRALLWTGHAESAVSHVSALNLWGVTDALPDVVDVVLPTKTRLRRAGGRMVRVHFEDLLQADMTWHEGIRVVRPQVALKQVIVSGFPTYLVKESLRKAVKARLISPVVSRDLRRQCEERDANV